jgi:hypothetical protein
MLPPRGRVTLLPPDDTSPDVPRIILPPDPTAPPIFVPGPTPPAPAPPTTGFIVHDIIGMLPTEPQNSIGVAPKNSLTVHWEGGAAIPNLGVNETVVFLQAIAAFHIRKNWAASGVVNGDGIMYHECIGQNGDIYLMRPDGAILYHANNHAINVSSRAILVLCSAQTAPTARQLTSLRQRVATIRGHWNANAPVYPHSRWSATECPGDTIRATIAAL